MPRLWCSCFTWISSRRRFSVSLVRRVQARSFWYENIRISECSLQTRVLLQLLQYKLYALTLSKWVHMNKSCSLVSPSTRGLICITVWAPSMVAPCYQGTMMESKNSWSGQSSYFLGCYVAVGGCWANGMFMIPLLGFACSMLGKN